MEKIEACIQRTENNEVYVELPCGYIQKFYIDYDDEESLIEVTQTLKKLGIPPHGKY